jgi:putative flippase GtrA
MDRNRRAIGELFRFGFVGIVVNAAGYLVYLGITYVGLPPELAVTVLYPIGAGLGFFAHRQATFGHEGPMAHTIAKYAGAQFTGYLLNLLILAVGVNCLRYSHEVVQAIAVVVVAAYLFAVMKMLVFHRGPAPEKGQG